ncbi:solute carrier family 46 member 3 [Aplysia californica]|uniref:Solute carrier family 46 member 3 n=1 Tax=Aplysia californica TaxID=6500 RepID=A0ABM0ZUU6_APLCA|nr:solute carrier family 46 member 3 [Aplysia californica]
MPRTPVRLQQTSPEGSSGSPSNATTRRSVSNTSRRSAARTSRSSTPDTSRQSAARTSRSSTPDTSRQRALRTSRRNPSHTPRRSHLERRRNQSTCTEREEGDFPDARNRSVRECALAWLAADAERRWSNTGLQNGSFTSSSSRENPPTAINNTGREQIPRLYEGSGPILMFRGIEREYEEDSFFSREFEPLLRSSRNPSGSRREDAGNENVTKRRRWNIIGALIGFGLSMVSYSMFSETYSQWIYLRFKEDIMGTNFSSINSSHALHPCASGQNNSAFSGSDLDRAQSEASSFMSWSLIVLLVPAFFSCIFMGAFSNKLGRRMLFIIPAAGFAVRVAVTCSVAYWHLNINFLYIGVAVSGACGSMVAMFMALYMYLADNTGESKSRSYTMVIASAMSTILLCSASLGIGYFIAKSGYLWPLVAALGGSTLALLWFIFVLRESVETGSFADCHERMEAVKDVFKFYLANGMDSRAKRSDFIILGVVFLMFGTCFGAEFMIMFLMNKPLCWSSTKIGYVYTFQGILQGFSSLILLPVFQKFISDEFICALALLSGAAGKIVLAFAVDDWMVYLAFVLGMLELLAIPMIRGILSRMSSKEKRGSLFASIAVIEVVTYGLSGFGMNMLYSATVAIWHGLAYSVISGCILVSSVLMGSYAVIVHRRAAGRESFVTVEVVHEGEGGGDDEGEGGGDGTGDGTEDGAPSRERDGGD